MPELYKIIYTSTAAQKFTQPLLQELMIKSQKYNLRAGITGFLAYHDTKFIQYLEGEESEVKTLYSMICRDIRHHDIKLKCSSHVAYRVFPEWTMAYRYMHDEAAENATIFDIFEGIVKPSSLASLCETTINIFEDYLYQIYFDKLSLRV